MAKCTSDFLENLVNGLKVGLVGMAAGATANMIMGGKERLELEKQRHEREMKRRREEAERKG